VEEKVPEFSTVVKEWLEGSVTQVALELDAAEGSLLKRRSSRASSIDTLSKLPARNCYVEKSLVVVGVVVVVADDNGGRKKG
jgi:hypothetical protein